MFLVKMLTSKEPEEEEWTFNKHMKLLDERFVLLMPSYVFALFLSPSHGFTAFIFLPISTVCVFIFTNFSYDMNDSEVFKIMIAKTIGFSTAVIVLSYMTQVREIIRFYEQQTVIKKGQELSGILNS